MFRQLPCTFIGVPSYSVHLMRYISGLGHRQSSLESKMAETLCSVSPSIEWCPEEVGFYLGNSLQKMARAGKCATPGVLIAYPQRTGEHTMMVHPFQ